MSGVAGFAVGFLTSRRCNGIVLDLEVSEGIDKEGLEANGPAKVLGALNVVGPANGALSLNKRKERIRTSSGI